MAMSKKSRHWKRRFRANSVPFRYAFRYPSVPFRYPRKNSTPYIFVLFSGRLVPVDWNALFRYLFCPFKTAPGLKNESAFRFSSVILPFRRISRWPPPRTFQKPPGSFPETFKEHPEDFAEALRMLPDASRKRQAYLKSNRSSGSVTAFNGHSVPFRYAFRYPSVPFRYPQENDTP